jgi:hypothetical protein
MAKIFSDGKIPKRFDGMVTYRLEGIKGHIVKEKTGFTKKGMAKDPKYAKSRENANEFGPVAHLCKEIRMILNEGLPKSKNLEVTNGLHTIMRKVMCCDTIAQRGNRCLKNGFASPGGKSLFTGHDFNPSGLLRNTFKGDYRFDVVKKQLVFEPFVTSEAFVFPEGADGVGLRLGALRFDFDTSVGFMKLSDLVLYGSESRITESLELSVEDFPDGEGVVFYLLEVAFFVEDEGTFISIPKNDTKVVYVLGVE